MSSIVDQFLEKLRASLESGSFVKLTLSQYHGDEAGLRNLYARAVDLKEGRRLSFVWRYATRDITKNLEFAEAVERLNEWLGADFERAHLFSTTGDWQLKCDRHGRGKLKASKATFPEAIPTEHDRVKPHALKPDAGGFLCALGVTTPAGEPRPAMADKLRQIQRFVELLGHVVDQSPLADRRELRVIDMGAGKGYLTFATYEFFRQRGVDVTVTGVEAREDMVELTNRVAREVGFAKLNFVRGAIGDFASEAPADLLMALHACNTATDDACFYGIRTGAAAILVAPCCHQELRPQLRPPPVLKEVLRHGILAEREAEILTDGIRALLLEIHGYKAGVSEFVSLEHTGRNLLISAQKRVQPIDPAPLRAQLRELLESYGIREQRLARLLGELPAAAARPVFSVGGSES